MKFKIIYALIFIIICSLGMSCSNSEGYENIKKYYFPVSQLTDGGRVYEYSLIGDTLGLSVFFKYESFPREDKVMFITTQFNSYCIQSAIYRDEIVHNGAIREAIRAFEYDENIDTTYITDLEVISGNVFPFEVKDSSRFLYKVVGYSQVDTTETSTIDQRIMYLGKTVHNYDGKHYDAIDFSIEKTRTEKSAERGDFEVKYLTRERYAQGLGLVYFTEKIGEQELQFKLTNVMKMEEFTKSCERMIYNDY